MGMSNLLEIDGSQGEGGGQILRTSLALSLITGKPFHLRNIRARRAKPGLQPQHLMSVKAAAQLGHAQTRGASRDSTDLVFEPGVVTPGKYQFAIGTAGATGLVLHTVYLPLAWRTNGPSELTLSGGTHVQTSPIYHFLEATWCGYLELLGLRVGLKLRRPGFYPRGGGVVEAQIQSVSCLNSIHILERPPVQAATVLSAAAGLPAEIATRQARRAWKRLRDRKLAVEVREETWEGGPGTVLIVQLETDPVPTLFFGLGAKGKPAERVADEAVEQALHYLNSGAPVDAHSADQLLLPLALAEGPSSLRVEAVTTHLTTNLAVIQNFLERSIVWESSEGGSGLVQIGHA